MLRVAATNIGNMQQPTQIDATSSATGTQQPPLKPPSLLEIARNKLRNRQAISANKLVQQALLNQNEEGMPLALTDACNNRPAGESLDQVNMRVSSLLHVARTREYAMQQAGGKDAGKALKATETRRQKVLELLEAAPENQRAILTDIHSDPDQVILTIAVRHVAVAEMMVPKSRYDPFLILELVEQYGTQMN